MNLKTFRKIATQVNALEAAKIKFDVVIRGDNEWQAGYGHAYFEPTHYEVGSLQQLSQVQAIIGQPIKLNDTYNKIKIEGLKPVACVMDVLEIIKEIKAKPAKKFKHPTLKFYSEQAQAYWYNFKVDMISQPPTAQVEDDITYRYIGDVDTCLFCIPHTHELYNYLDEGFFFCHTQKSNEKEKLIITNELTLDTYLIMLLVWLNPVYAKQLTNECYINANTAKLLRIKLEKDFPAQFKHNYEQVRNGTLKEYEKRANSNLLQKVADGKVPHATYNNIRFTANSATYETISIEAEGLLNTLQLRIAFDDRTDIYSVIRDYITYVIGQLEDEDLQATKTALVMPIATGDAVADKKAMDVYLDALSKEVTAEYKFSINKNEITLKRTSENTRRYINGVTINKIEVEDVTFQASCYDTKADYDKFVKSVSKMSLKWHNALANGIPVKISSSLGDKEYKIAEAPSASPRIKFMKDEKDFKLMVNDKDSVKIKFNECLTRLATLNRKTNNGYLTTGYGRRDHNWAKRELINILKECCTFDIKKINVIEADEPVMLHEETPDGPVATPQLNKDGTQKMKKVKRKEAVVTTECYLTDEQAKFIGKMAEEFQMKALEKSQKFLADAIRNTGAKIVNFQGEEGYLVEGKLRKYVVVKRTNQVMNYDTKGYICIVEPGHQVSVGGDATAARLYALKNDSVMTGQIGTLRHG